MRRTCYHTWTLYRCASMKRSWKREAPGVRHQLLGPLGVAWDGCLGYWPQFCSRPLCSVGVLHTTIVGGRDELHYWIRLGHWRYCYGFHFSHVWAVACVLRYLPLVGRHLMGRLQPSASKLMVFTRIWRRLNGC